ncbi:MAG: hypothetical protein BYD32DRAFT_373043 [Podila humilis]|nr:MAG: hypothetical protein BYD32DRAFT_373043 [Podila humilis]
MSNLKSSNGTTLFQSKSRTLFLCLVFSAILFVFAVQIEWVPHLNYFSSTNDDTPDSFKQEHDTPSPSTPPSLSSPSSPLTPPSPSSPSSPTKDQPLQLNGNQEHNPFLTMFPPRPPMDQERFLAYIPHSGFHNQLITLENALRLAAMLNRTLLLPPLHMSHKRQALVWKVPPVLFQQWADRNRTNVGYCRDHNPLLLPAPTRKQLRGMTEQQRRELAECTFYHQWTMAPWTYFYDIPKILTGVIGIGGQTEPIRVFSRPNMSLTWLEEHLQVKDPSTEIYYFNDTNRYEYRIADDSETDTNDTVSGWSGRYSHTIPLSSLLTRPERILHFGSLFATDRVEARSPKHRALKSYISHNMDLWNQDILDATKLAEQQIEEWRITTKRSAPGFLGAHLRTADGIFERLIPTNLGRIIAWLQEMTNLDQKMVNNEKRHSILRKRQDPLAKMLQSNKYTRPTMNRKSMVKREDPSEAPTFLERCIDAPAESPLVFLSTDVHRPRQDPALTELLDQFPCTMFLSDFEASLQVLEKIQNPFDGVYMLPYMIALMDANLAAKGRHFKGTERSTFSAYIMNHLWPSYHPEEPESAVSALR